KSRRKRRSRRAKRLQSRNRRSSPVAYGRKSANSLPRPLRLERRSPFIRPARTLRETSSSVSSRRRKSDDNSGSRAAGSVIGGGSGFPRARPSPGRERRGAVPGHPVAHAPGSDGHPPAPPPSARGSAATRSG